jgi:hypothetical protein
MQVRVYYEDTDLGGILSHLAWQSRAPLRRDRADCHPWGGGAQISPLLPLTCSWSTRCQRILSPGQRCTVARNTNSKDYVEVCQFDIGFINGLMGADIDHQECMQRGGAGLPVPIQATRMMLTRVFAKRLARPDADIKQSAD